MTPWRQCRSGGAETAFFVKRGVSGFSLIEFLVAVSVVAILSTFVVIGREAALSGEALGRLTNAMTVDLRRTQNMALAATTSSGGVSSGGYGVVFENSTATSYVIFSDRDGDQQYDPPASGLCPSGECLARQQFERDIRLGALAVGPTGSNAPGGTTTSLTVLYCPPYATTLIYGNADARGTNCNGNRTTMRQHGLVSLVVGGHTPSPRAVQYVRTFASGSVEAINEETRQQTQTLDFPTPPKFQLPPSIFPPPASPIIPSPPTGLACTSGDQQVTLNWNASTGASSYTLYMAEVTGVTKMSATMQHPGITLTSFPHTALTNGTTYHFIVAAVNSFGESAESAETSCAPTATAVFSAKINFQPNGSPLYAGYLPDYGATFANRGNGFTYGWSGDNTVNTRDRNNPASPDQRYDTLNHMQKAGTPCLSCTWELAVTPGTYQVHLVAGDPSFFDSVYRINVEGQLAISDMATGGELWMENTVTVTVTDGRLTVSNAAAGSTNNKINFIEVTKL